MVPSMDWAERAACKDKPLNWFFPPKGGSARKAKALCDICPVIEECRKAFDVMEGGGRTPGYIHGIVGGETATERAARRRAEVDEAAA